MLDREAVLDKATILFWQHGYEAILLTDLVEATGARAPTLYMGFTNKEELSRTVLDRYITRFAAKHEAQLFCEEKSPKSALEDCFTAIATCSANKGTLARCFMVDISVTLAVSFRDIAYTVKSRHAMQE